MVEYSVDNVDWQCMQWCRHYFGLCILLSFYLKGYLDNNDENMDIMKVDCSWWITKIWKIFESFEVVMQCWAIEEALTIVTGFSNALSLRTHGVATIRNGIKQKKVDRI